MSLLFSGYFPYRHCDSYTTAMAIKNRNNHDVLAKTLQLATDFLENLDSASVGTLLTYDKLYGLWDKNLPVTGLDPASVIDEINQAARPGLLLNQSGRFFSWVIGGSHPSALAADWLTSTWDQNAGLFAVAPSAAIAEEIAGTWLKKIFKLPDHSSFAFVTGCQMAHFTCLNAARNHLFHNEDWDIETQGFYGAPMIRIICSDQKHVTVSRAVRMLGFGTNTIREVPTDERGCVNVSALENELKNDPGVPAIVMLQAGDVNSGAYDDFKSIIPVARKYKSWIHIDGAFGLWATASARHQHLTEGMHDADSWATDGHKWLNVPYDCGYAFTAHPEAHHRSLALHASYLTLDKKARDEMDWTPEFSRRARGFATYAAIKELGTQGIEALIDRTCSHAHTIIEQIGKFPHTEIIAKPVINQGLIRFLHPSSQNESDHDVFTETIIKKINDTGEAFFQPTTFKGRRCMRVSVSGWRTNEDDVRRTVTAIEKVLQALTQL